jgi:hypothetical protein
MMGRIRRLKEKLNLIVELVRKVDDLQKAVGRLEMRMSSPRERFAQMLHAHEFKVYSQWGEDGIIQFLIHTVEITNPVFVEFGVQDYKESNTRFLLQNDNWSGLVIDASRENIGIIKSDALSYRNDLKADCDFIDRDNINQIITRNGIAGDIGLLSIDIDGNDYWVWDAIDCVSPRIVICEYDSLLGARHPVSTPYDKSFDRLRAHYSFLYGGASIRALHSLGKKKGYSLIGSNSAGNNLFFVRDDVRGALPALAPEEAYVKARFRNSKDREGRMTFLSFDESLKLIRHMPLQDVESGKMVTVGDATDH